MCAQKFRIGPPKKSAAKNPSTKNGPNGIVLPNFFLPKTIKSTEITAPLKNAKNSAKSVPLTPKTIPIKKAKTMSPCPIPRPQVTKTIKRKKIAAPKAATIESINRGVDK